MFKRIITFLTSIFLLFSLCGCVALFAGAAGGAGTAAWLSGKLTQEFHSPYTETTIAAKKALESMQLPIVKEVTQETVSQFRSKYSDGREIWIDVHKISEESSKVEVRVGALNSNKQAATDILKQIQKYL